MNRKFAMFGAVALALSAAACTEAPEDEVVVVEETETVEDTENAE